MAINNFKHKKKHFDILIHMIYFMLGNHNEMGRAGNPPPPPHPFIILDK